MSHASSEHSRSSQIESLELNRVLLNDFIYLGKDAKEQPIFKGDLLVGKTDTGRLTVADAEKFALYPLREQEVMSKETLAALLEKQPRNLRVVAQIPLHSIEEDEPADEELDTDQQKEAKLQKAIFNDQPELQKLIGGNIYWIPQSKGLELYFQSPRLTKLLLQDEPLYKAVIGYAEIQRFLQPGEHKLYEGGEAGLLMSYVSEGSDAPQLVISQINFGQLSQVDEAQSELEKYLQESCTQLLKERVQQQDEEYITAQVEQLSDETVHTTVLAPVPSSAEQIAHAAQRVSTEEWRELKKKFLDRRPVRKKEPVTSENLDQAFEQYQAHAAAVNAADVLVVIGKSGFGDRPYQAQAALSLQASYPDKRIIFIDPRLYELYDPALFTSAQSMFCRSPNDEVMQEFLQKEPYQKVCFLSFDPVTLPTEEAVKDIQRQLSPTAEVALAWVPDTVQPHFHSLLWQEWGKVIAPPSLEQDPFFQLDQFGNELYLKPGQHTTLLPQKHQILTAASRLVNFFNLDPQAVQQAFLTNPFKKEYFHPAVKKPETLLHDVIIAYDSSTRRGMRKTLGEFQLVGYVEELVKRGISEERIAFIVGKTDQQVARTLLRMFPGIRPIQGNLERIVRSCLRSAVMVTADSGIGHIINQYCRQAVEEPGKYHVPHIIELFGLGARYNIQKFRLDMATVMVHERIAADIFPAQLADVTEQNFPFPKKKNPFHTSRKNLQGE